MKPRRTPESTTVWRLPGGNEDNDLWARNTVDVDGSPVVESVWQPDDEERAIIAAGGCIRLVVWGGQPPVAIGVYDGPLGAADRGAHG